MFSFTDYAAITRDLNSWMHLLSEILATEPFIIAGTSLSESDLEYYLSKRTDSSPKRGVGPSFLIDPSPDTITRAYCERHGLHLIENTFEGFMRWLNSEFPTAPTVAELIIPKSQQLFGQHIPKQSILKLFSGFRLMSHSQLQRGNELSAFLFGAEISQNDLDRGLDISRTDNGTIQNDIDMAVRHKLSCKVHVVLDEPGGGKSTLIRRVGHDLVGLGVPVLEWQGTSRIDTRNCIECLSGCVGTVLVLVDNFADHAEQVLEIVTASECAGKIVVLGADRIYRSEHISTVFAGINVSRHRVRDLSPSELRQLIESYTRFGLVGVHEAVHDPSKFASGLTGDPIAVAACRILNQFEPLEHIARSMWAAANDDVRFAYLAAALARHCDARGVQYSILHAAIAPSKVLSDLFTTSVSLRLIDTGPNDDYVVPINATIADVILKSRADAGDDLVYRAFCQLADELAPHVNRSTIKMRTPESGLARRLFDVDSVVRPLLRSKTEAWFTHCHNRWRWNSRYWEQRALLVSEVDPDLALRYARHAVSIEVHSFTLTTLAKILFKVDERHGYMDDNLFGEAVELLENAIYREQYRSRITIHPFATLYSGVLRRIRSGRELTSSQLRFVKDSLSDANQRFGHDVALKRLIGEIAAELP